MAVVLDVIVSSLKEIGVLAAGETATAEDAADALAALNRLMDQWAAERLQIFTITRTPFTIVSGTGAYSIAGTATVPRPVFLDHVTFQDTSTSPTTEYPLHPLTDDAYAAIRLKGLTSPFPSSWFWNPTFPAGILSLFPVPTGTTLQGVTYAPQPAASFAALNTAISLPPGYEELLVSSLAIRLAPSYERQVHPSLRERAVDAKAIVKRANIRLSDLGFSADALIGGGGGGWSIRTGS